MRYELIIQEKGKDKEKLLQSNDFEWLKKVFDNVIKEHWRYYEVEIIDNERKCKNGNGVCVYSLSLLEYRGEIGSSEMSKKFISRLQMQRGSVYERV